jgi:aerobic-type carbon monoxide dehydrogenase small subunit (CoxS/CutS family)
MAWGWVDVPLRTIRLNGKKVTAAYGSVPADGATPEASEQLLYWLREQHDQRGPKFGCGVAQCGACTVLIDGAPVRSCTRQMHTVPELADVRTLDGLASGKPHSLQDAFVERQAGQCAFCINGMVMGSLGWLESRIAAGDRSVPSDAEVRDFLAGVTAATRGAEPENYLCRCGAHNRIVAAVRQAAEEMVK